MSSPTSAHFPDFSNTRSFFCLYSEQQQQPKRLSFAFKQSEVLFVVWCWGFQSSSKRGQRGKSSNCYGNQKPGWRQCGAWVVSVCVCMWIYILIWHIKSRIFFLLMLRMPKWCIAEHKCAYMCVWARWQFPAESLFCDLPQWLWMSAVKDGIFRSSVSPLNKETTRTPSVSSHPPLRSQIRAPLRSIFISVLCHSPSLEVTKRRSCVLIIPDCEQKHQVGPTWVFTS